MGFLQNILHDITGGTAPVQQPAVANPKSLLTVPAHPASVFSFPSTGVTQPNGHYQPAQRQQYIQNMPQVASPQNLSQYGNAQGQHWMENDQGQKFGMPQLQPYNTVGDQRIVPTSNHYNRPAIAAPQWQTVQQPQLRTQII